MAITKDVNTKLLNECYELAPFHGLCKPHKDDVLEPTQEEEQLMNRNLNFIITAFFIKKIKLNYLIASEIKHKLSESGIMQS
jgi:hypothetical protein